MGMMNSIKDKMSGMSDEMRERLHMLEGKEKTNTLSDSERTELDRMRGSDSSAMQ